MLGFITRFIIGFIIGLIMEFIRGFIIIINRIQRRKKSIPNVSQLANIIKTDSQSLLAVVIASSNTPPK